MRRRRRRVPRRRRLLSGPLVPALLLLLLVACPAPRPDGPQPLPDFSERVTVLVTTSTRGELRDHPARQTLLRVALPELREQNTVEQLLEHLRAVAGLAELAERIERAVEFELENPDHREVRDNYHDPAVQRQVVAAIVLGMERGLEQLQGD